MKNMIKFEFRKLFRHISFYVLMGVCLLWTVLNGLMLTVAAMLIPEIGVPSTVYDFTRSAVSTNSMIFVGIFLAIFVVEDFANGSIKNVVSKGYNNTTVYFSKYIVSLVAAVMMCLASIISGVLYGLIFFREAGSFDSVGYVIPGILLSIIVYHAMFFLICISVRKMAPAVVLTIVGPMGLDLVLSLVGIFTQDRFKFNISNYWLSGILTNFGSGADTKIYLVELILLVVYLAAFVVAGYFINRDREIK